MKQWNDLDQEKKVKYFLKVQSRKEKRYTKKIPDRVTALEVSVMDLKNDIQKLVQEITRLQEIVDG